MREAKEYSFQEMNLKEKITDFLKSNIGQRFTARQIAEWNI
ncbi:MAG: hypothetical protein AB8V23_05465 [Candidatus Midichloria sp.]|uniref:Uncharacterized protein n=1 Tax=Hyalomma marginatum TaxID=34627 RepID=A0A8S4BVQ2_9ACAR|nr:hypothetical protein MHYMCMPASI_00207 [Hyalomma marginatum]CAG7590337.1 hypothetical protein MHYMCMPSP_00270 [Hyalomma marginatum]